MGSFRPVPIQLGSGFVKGEGSLAASGRYIDGDKVRFRASLPEKIGGWARSTLAPFRGIARALHSWNDLVSRSYTAIGTTLGLYVVGADATPVIITPQILPTSSLTSAFKTVSASKFVTVLDTAHGLVTGQGITFTSASTVGGLDMNGSWVVASVIDPNSYTFEHTSAAATTVAVGTGSATAAYDIAPGAADPAQGFGWGVSGWGQGTWGTARAASSVFYEPSYWSLDNFGQLLIASQFEGPLYSWDPTTLPVPRATLLASAQAPGAVRGFWVTPERFIIAYGTTSGPAPDTAIDPLQLWWCHQGVHTTWTPSSTNTANRRRLTQGKRIMAGGSLGARLSLVWTDSALFTHVWTGSQYVFDTALVATGCGLYGPHAFTFAGAQALWVGSGNFHRYAGGYGSIPNSQDVSDWIFDQLRLHYEPKTVCYFNQRFNEVWWFFTTDGATEPDLYAAVNLSDWSWVTGTMERTGALRDAPTSGDSHPVLASTDGYLYQHEVGKDANGDPILAWVETAPFEVANGATDMQVHAFIPDFGRHEGDLALEVTAYDRTPTTDGGTEIDYNIAEVGPGFGMVDLRLAGRLASFKISSAVLGGDFRLGKPKFEISSGGRRR